MSVQDHTQRGGDDGGSDLAAIQFRAFAAALIRARARVVQVPEAEGRAAAVALSAELCQLIALQNMEAVRRAGHLGSDVETQARLIKAALADEVLLNIDWAGRSYWRHVLVEATLLGSAQAGEQMFNNIDQLLNDNDPARRPVARLYLNLLALGFQGRYRGADLAPLADYRRRLFQFAYQRAPDLAARDAVLTAQPYGSTLSYSHQRLPRLSRRGTLLALSLVLLLALSQGLWLTLSAPVRTALADREPVAGMPKAAP
ncbi:MAG: DotU family type IV/VI secretion system protein [Duganella sp.]